MRRSRLYCYFTLARIVQNVLAKKKLRWAKVAPFWLFDPCDVIFLPDNQLCLPLVSSLLRFRELRGWLSALPRRCEVGPDPVGARVKFHVCVCVCYQLYYTPLFLDDRPPDVVAYHMPLVSFGADSVNTYLTFFTAVSWIRHGRITSSPTVASTKVLLFDKKLVWGAGGASSSCFAWSHGFPAETRHPWFIVRLILPTQLRRFYCSC